MELNRIFSLFFRALFIISCILFILLAVSAVFNLLFTLSGIDNSPSKIEEVPIKHGNIYVTEIYRDYKNGGIFYVIVDDITGIQYIFMDYGYSGGLSPRYNIDGSLYVMNKSITL